MLRAVLWSRIVQNTTISIRMSQPASNPRRRYKGPKRDASTVSAVAASPSRQLPLQLPPAAEDVTRPQPTSSRPVTPTHSGVRFLDFHTRGLLSQQTVTNLPFEYCTPVQAETLGPILEGHDMYVASSFFS